MSAIEKMLQEFTVIIFIFSELHAETIEGKLDTMTCFFAVFMFRYLYSSISK